MKAKDISSLVVIAIIAAVMSFILANLIFPSPAGQTSQVPVVPDIPTAFPDIYNDPVYHQFLNKNGLDPTQPVNIGNANNNQPFNSSQ